MMIKKMVVPMVILIGSISGIPAFSNNQSLDNHFHHIQLEKSVDSIFRVHYPNRKLANQAKISFHNQLLEANHEEGYLVMELTDEEIEQLKRFGFTVSVDKAYIEKRNRFLDEMAQKLQTYDGQLQSIPGYSCYETVEETLAVAEAMARDKPNIASFIDVGDSWQKTEGDGGYDIKVLVLTNKDQAGDKPILFINSAIHAREYTTAPLNLDFARWLYDGYGTNADATWILDHQEVHLMLQTNPDGRKRAETGLSWRKNTNQNFCNRANSRGVDLNRNFSFKWNITNGQGSSGNQCSGTFRGPSPGSEPEIQALENYVRSLWPDRRGENNSDAAPVDTSGIHIDLHSFSELVLWPWGETRQVAPNGIALQTLGRKFAYYNDYEPIQSVGLYPTDGTSDNVSYGELGVAAYTFELGTSFFQNCSQYENRIKPDNLPALIYAAKASRAPYIIPAGPNVEAVGLSNNAETDGVPAGTPVTVSALVSDDRFSRNSGTENTQNIQSARAYIGQPPWEPGSVAINLSASDGSFNEREEAVSGVLNTSGLAPGKYLVYVQGTDASNSAGAVTAAFLNITEGDDGGGEDDIKANFTFDCANLQCSFNASSSQGDIDNFAWSFGDGTGASGPTANKTFSASGEYTVTLTVSNDATGKQDSISRSVSVSEPAAISLALSSGRFFFFFTYVDLDWSGAAGGRVDVYRDGALIGSENNDGNFRNFVGRGEYRYRLCEQGSTTRCSAEESISVNR